jgi:hypothetical protein
MLTVVYLGYSIVNGGQAGKNECLFCVIKNNLNRFNTPIHSAERSPFDYGIFDLIMTIKDMHRCQPLFGAISNKKLRCQ